MVTYKRFILLAFFLSLLWPMQAEWTTRYIGIGQVDAIDTAIVSIDYAVDDAGNLVQSIDDEHKNWLWQLETTGEVCPLTGTRYYYFKNVNTGLYFDGSDRPVRNKRQAWRYTFVSIIDSIYGEERYKGAEGFYFDYINDTTAFFYNHFISFSDTVEMPIPAMAVHFSEDEDSINIDGSLHPMFAYDDGKSYALDRLVAYKDSLARIYWKPEREYVVGDGVGQISQALLDSVRARYDEMLETYYLTDLPGDAYDAARLRLQAALHSADSAAACVPEGYYRFTGYWAYVRKKHYALRSDAGGTYAVEVGPLAASEVFHVEALPGGGYSVRSVADSLYLGPVEMQQSNTSATLMAPLYFDHAGSDSLSLYGFDAKGIRQCYCLMGGFKVVDGERRFSVITYGSRYAWHLEPMNEPRFVDSLRLAVAQTWRDRHLAALIDTASAATDSARVAYQMARPEVAQAVQRLRAAIAEARGVTAGTTTMAHLEALKAPYDAFLAVWADSTDLEALVQHARWLVSTTSYTGYSPGHYPDYAVNELREDVDRVETLRPFARLNKVQTDSATEVMQTALRVFQSQVSLPEEDEVYFIISDMRPTPMSDRARQTYHHCLYASDYDAHAPVKWGGRSNEHEQNGLAAWRFVRLGEGRFALQNLASAWYLGATIEGRLYMSDTIVPYRFVPLGEGLLALQSEGSDLLVTPHWENRLITGEAPAGDYLQAWTFADVDAERMTDVKSFKPASAHLVTVPYATTQLPTSLVATLRWFNVVGAQRDDEGRVTALALKLTEDETLQPAHPYVLVVGNSIEGDDDVYVDMCLDLYNPWPDTTTTAQNGLTGTLHDLTLRRDGLALGGSGLTLQPTTAEAVSFVLAQQGYVCLGRVPEVQADAACDAWLPVAGPRYAPRDHNKDGRVNLPDAVQLIGRITDGRQTDADLYDHNHDGRTNLPDAEIIIEQVSNR